MPRAGRVQATDQARSYGRRASLLSIGVGITGLIVVVGYHVHAAHAAGAVHLGKGIIERDIETAVPDKNTELILYCGGGYRSALAADALQKMGYTNVFSMAGGWKAWKEAGGEVET